MADIINLSRTRKARARADKALQAEANRIAFGRTKAEKLATQAEAQKAKSTLDGARREGPEKS
jgi:hypothetical protein